MGRIADGVLRILRYLIQAVGDGLDMRFAYQLLLLLVRKCGFQIS